MTALAKIEENMRVTNTWQSKLYLVLTWQGHMLDMLGKRDQALQKYSEALAICGDKRENPFHTNIFIDRQWLQERLEKPFAW